MILAMVNVLHSFLNAQQSDSVCTAFDCCRPDGHAPLGIMTDHVHGKGEFAFTYSYENMAMKGNRVGENKVDNSEVFNTYLMAPKRMTMQMHMFMGMYSINQKLTVMGMLGYSLNNMSMDMLPGTVHNHGGMVMGMTNMHMDMKTAGISDSKIYALYKLADKRRQRLILGLGLSIPTGSINERGETLLGDGQRLSYPMQLGTGTFDFLPSLTYIAQKNALAWGAYLGANVKPFTNEEGYTWGNEYVLSGWVSYKCCSFLSGSFRLEGIQSDEINGYDKSIGVLLNNDPNSNANNFGGKKATTFVGVNIYNYKSALKGARILAEYGIPLYQNLNGPQMNLNSIFQVGAQYNF